MEILGIIFTGLSLITGLLGGASAKKQQKQAATAQYLYEASLLSAQNKVASEQTQAELKAMKEVEASRFKAYQTILEIQRSAGFQRGTAGPLFQMVKR